VVVPAPPAGGQAPALQEVRVERGTLRRTVLATGVVEPQNRVEIKPPIAGRIEDVLVREGETWCARARCWPG
jgi:macrolide-specific efflux system membrane fusion protein